MEEVGIRVFLRGLDCRRRTSQTGRSTCRRWPPPVPWNSSPQQSLSADLPARTGLGAHHAGSGRPSAHLCAPETMEMSVVPGHRGLLGRAATVAGLAHGAGQGWSLPGGSGDSPSGKLRRRPGRMGSSRGGQTVLASKWEKGRSDKPEQLTQHFPRTDDSSAWEGCCLLFPSEQCMQGHMEQWGKQQVIPRPWDQNNSLANESRQGMERVRLLAPGP